MGAPAEGGVIFLKLGGSLITDKTAPESVREEALARAAHEIAAVCSEGCALVLGHGSGSFGHSVAAAFNTRAGVETEEQWLGFVKVADVALRLTAIVRGRLLAAGVPVVSLSPRASLSVHDGEVKGVALEPVLAALGRGLVPLLHGDVAFDARRGGTIVSTEELFAALMEQQQQQQQQQQQGQERDTSRAGNSDSGDGAGTRQVLTPRWLLLAGETAGVLDAEGATLPEISASNWGQLKAAVGGSRGADVTGGMRGKVESALHLVERHRGAVSVLIFDGLAPGAIAAALRAPATAPGTRVVWRAAAGSDGAGRPAAGPISLCSVCEEAAAALRCNNCRGGSGQPRSKAKAGGAAAGAYCRACFVAFHKPRKFHGHTAIVVASMVSRPRVDLGALKTRGPASSAPSTSTASSAQQDARATGLVSPCAPQSFRPDMQRRT